MNILGMLFLKRIPPDDDEDEKDKVEKTVDDKNDSNAEENQKENTGENIKLLKIKKPLKIVYRGEYDIIQVVKTPDVHLVLWPCILATCVSFVYTFNLEVFLKSFDLLNLKATIMLVGSIIAAVAKLGCSLLSDLTLTRFPRILYFITTLAFQSVCILFCCFLGDTPTVVTITALCNFVAMAVYMVMAPILISDLFGTTYLASIWGALTLIGGVVAVSMSYTMGALYDLQVAGDDDTCYGLKCFKVMFIISTVLCVASLAMTGVYYKKELTLLNSQDCADQSNCNDLSVSKAKQ